MTPTLQHACTKFLKSRLRNTWLTTPEMNVYVRKGVRTGKFLPAQRFIVIGNVTVQKKLRNQGRFTRFLEFCQSQTDFDGVLIENVLAPNLQAYLDKRAFTDMRWQKIDYDSYLWERALCSACGNLFDVCDTVRHRHKDSHADSHTDEGVTT